MATLLWLSTLALAGKADLALLARAGLPARDFRHFSLQTDVATLPVGAELGVALQRRGDRIGFRPSLAVEAWFRRWRDLDGGTTWGQEVGVRLEPRLAMRLILSPHRMWTRRWRVVPTLDVAAGAAVVVFAEGRRGWGAFSPVAAVRPALHFGRYEPWFIAVDARLGIRSRTTQCLDYRPYCPEVWLDPGGTSVGALIGKTL